MSNPDLNKLLADEGAKVAAMTVEERREYLDQIVAIQRANAKPYTEGERQARAMRPQPTPAEEEMVQAAYNDLADRRMDKVPVQCAECDCDNPPHGCNWIKAGPSLDDVLELPEIKAMVEAAFCEGYYADNAGAGDYYSRAWKYSDAFAALQKKGGA